jgi:hypothetical protein
MKEGWGSLRIEGVGRGEESIDSQYDSAKNEVR